MLNKTAYFTSSLALDNHPMKYVKSKLKEQYYLVLAHFVKKCKMNEYTTFRLKQYQDFLLKRTGNSNIGESDLNAAICSIVNSRYRHWRKKYRYWLMCDIALILLDETDIQKVAKDVKDYLSKRQIRQFDILLTALKDDKTDTTAISFADALISQYRKNYNFFKTPELRFIVTANMSAGKSTLINALIGKPITRTSQEVCTGNICYIYNKAFEDNHIHLEDLKPNLDAIPSDLSNFEWARTTNIASHFRFICKQDVRVCIIDTPGVNSAMNREHGKIAREALGSENYDKLIYVLNSNKLGTEQEISHLKWVSENIPKDKLIFVLNKLDDFKSVDDNIQASIQGVVNDLLALGFVEPLICPLSAYFALLTKLKHNGETLTEDEEDEYTLYRKKFSKPAYDLSKHMNGIQDNDDDSENLSISKKNGLYGLEKILFGGLV